MARTPIHPGEILADELKAIEIGRKIPSPSDRLPQTEDKLTALLLEGLNSGQPIEVLPE
jgi:hypothetical protein